MNEPVSKTKFSEKTLARLAAVQALYRSFVSKDDIKDIISQFMNNPEVLLEETQKVHDIDIDIFSFIAEGTDKNKETIDSMIEEASNNKEAAKRYELLLKAILRAGIFELMENQKIQKDIIINDYVEITHSFFNAKEPALVNAILDNVGKKIRN